MSTPRSEPQSERGRNSGSVLIIVAWTLLALSVLSLAVSVHVSANLRTAGSLASRCETYYAARAGVAVAIASVSGETNGWDGFEEPWHGDEKRFSRVQVGRAMFTVSCSNRWDEAGSVSALGLVDEEGKVNVNAATNALGAELLRSLMELAGNMDRDEAERIAACVADWIDGDDEPRKNGAENGYYMGLGRPYRCHNDRIDSLAELRFVRGINGELFEKIQKHMTVFGTNVSININTANRTVLASLTGANGSTPRDVCRAVAERIVEFRERGNSLKSLKKREIRNELFGPNDPSGGERAEWAALEWLLNHRMVAVHSRHVCGISTGRSAGTETETADRCISFVYDRKRNEMRAWNER
ncbi:MAG: hypothetical protein E4H02_03750 [Lentisphaerales bacterium]|nr:MAG: hypothetical protein E4H02_03750 [Lentisphaerales bacterium]